MSLRGAIWITLAIVLLPTSALIAGQFGSFKYEVHGEEIHLTGYPDNAEGEVIIPASIDGRPVTTISGSVMSGRTERK